MQKKGGGHIDYRWKAENLIRSSPYLRATSHKKLESPIIVFQAITLTRNFKIKKSIEMAAIAYANRLADPENLYIPGYPWKAESL